VIHAYTNQSERGKYKYKERKTEINKNDEGTAQAVKSQHGFKNALIFYEVKQIKSHGP
jgi:hypothetical protein